MSKPRLLLMAMVFGVCLLSVLHTVTAAEPTVSTESQQHSCPLQVSDLSLTSRSWDSSVQVFGFLMAVNSGGHTVSAVLSTVNSAGQPGPDLAVPPFDPTRFQSASGSKARASIVVGQQGLSAIRLKRVTVDGVETACSSAALATSTLANDDATSVNPDSAQVGALPDTAVLPVQVDEKDADFVRRVTPAYPPDEAYAGFVGLVHVRIRVLSSGSASRAFVDETSGDDALDMAAVRAAMQSAFKPATVNGIPVTRQYRIVYDFQLDKRFGPGHQLTTNCGVQLVHAFLIGHVKAPTAGLYEFELRSQSDSISSVNLVVGDLGQPGLEIEWPQVVWHKVDQDKPAQGVANGPSYLTDLRVVLDRLPSVVGLMTVQEATKSIACDFNPIHIWDTVDDQAEISAATPAPTVNVLEIVSSTQFVKRIYPRYPDRALSRGLGGSCDVLVSVDQHGHPRKADIANSCGEGSLDSAAIGAAMASTYAPIPGLLLLKYSFAAGVPGTSRKGL